MVTPHAHTHTRTHTHTHTHLVIFLYSTFYVCVCMVVCLSDNDHDGGGEDDVSDGGSDGGGSDVSRRLVLFLLYIYSALCIGLLRVADLRDLVIFRCVSCLCVCRSVLTCHLYLEQSLTARPCLTALLYCQEFTLKRWPFMIVKCFEASDWQPREGA